MNYYRKMDKSNMKVDFVVINDTIYVTYFDDDKNTFRCSILANRSFNFNISGHIHPYPMDSGKNIQDWYIDVWQETDIQGNMEMA